MHVYIHTYIHAYIHTCIKLCTSFDAHRDSNNWHWDCGSCSKSLEIDLPRTTFSSLVYAIYDEANSATHCNTLQHAATHCHTQQHTATHFNTTCLVPPPPPSSPQSMTERFLQQTATHCHHLFLSRLWIL